MKSIGIVRRLDDLGRIVLPMELRRKLNLQQGDALEIYTDKDKIILRKYHPGCIFCDEIEGVIKFNGQYICPDCLNKISNLKAGKKNDQ